MNLGGRKMSKGKRYSNESKLNMKKVFAVLIAVAVIAMFVIVIGRLLTTAKEAKNTSVVSYYPVYTNEKWGVIDSLGNVVIQPTMAEMITIPDPKTDVFICLENVDYTNNTYTTKVMNSKNKELFSKYDSVEAIENKDENGNLWYAEGVLKVKKADKYGLINLSGKELLPVEYSKIEPLLEYKNSFLITKQEKVGVCDEKGSIIVEPQYTQILGIGKDNRNGYIVVNSENKYGIIDITKKTILEPKYEDIKPISSNNLYVVKQEGAYQVIDKTEAVVIKAGKFDEIIQIQGENLIFVKNKKYGVINSKAEEVIRAQYEDLKYAFSNYYIAKNGGKYGIVSDTEVVVPFNYASITYRKEADFIELEQPDTVISKVLNNQFEEQFEGIVAQVNTDKGYIRARVNDEYQYYNLKFEKKTAQEVLTGNTLFLSKKEGKYGYVDKDGNVVVDYIYEDGLEQNTFGYIAVKKDGKWGALDKQGKQIAECQYTLENNIVIDFIGKWHLGEDLNSNYYTDQN